MLAPVIIALVVGYLLGSLPFGYLVARARGVNIFAVGSRNPGATNVSREVGPWWGRLVLLLDALKGAAATAWPFFHADGTTDDGKLTALRLSFAQGDTTSIKLAMVGLVGALLGHSFSCFTKFRGGKGVATGAGGFLVVFPFGVAIAFVVWLTVRTLTRYVSLASMVAAVSLPVSAWFRHEAPVLVGASAVVALFVVVRHRANISRLLAGTESRLGQKAPAPKS